MSILSSLSGQILDILRKSAQNPPLQEFDVARALKLIRQLKPYSHEFYHSFLGCLYSVTGKADESIAEHKQALLLAPEDAMILANYASSLAYLQRYRESYDMYTSILHKNKGDIVAHAGAIISAYFDDIPELNTLLDNYEKLTGEKHHVSAWVEEDAVDERAVPQMLEECKNGPYISIEELQRKLGL